MTVALSQLDYEKALINYLRWKLTDPEGRGSTATETFSGDDSTTDFTVAQNGVKYIGTVTVGSSEKVFNQDYTVDFKNSSSAAVVTFRTAPTTGTDNISITYGYGSTWVYPFMPNVNAHMPIISIKRIGASSRTLAAGNPGRWFKPNYQIGVHVRQGEAYSISSKNYAGSELVAYLSDQVNNKLCNGALGDIYALLISNQDGSAPLPYDAEEKVLGCADTYTFTFEQRF